MIRVLIVGSGITGALTASFIRNTLKHTCQTVIWEKSSKPGGRMATAVYNQEPWCSVDLGAQYLSIRPQEYQDHFRYYKELEDCGLIKPMTCTVVNDKNRPDGTCHYVAPSGISSLVKHYLSSSGASVHYNRPVQSLRLVDNVFVATSHNCDPETFDCVVLTTPVPEIFNITGDVNAILDSTPEVKKKLQQVVYSTRYALGVFFEKEAQLNLDWTMKYFRDPIIRFVSVDTEKRSVVGSTRPTMLVHTTINFGQEAGDKDENEVCFDIILPHLYSLLPQLPKAVFVATQRWNYSQVLNAYPESTGALTLKESPLLIAGGDAFAVSRFDGSIASARQITEAIADFARQKDCSD